MNSRKWLAWVGVPVIGLTAGLTLLWSYGPDARAGVLPGAPVSPTSGDDPSRVDSGSIGSENGGTRDRLRALIEAQDSAGSGCFEAGICRQLAGFEHRGDGIVVWWHGEVPPTVLKAGETAGIEVRVEDAPYGQLQIVEAKGRLIDALLERSLPGIGRAQVYSIIESHRGQGVIVAVDKAVLGDRVQLERSMTAVAGLPVTIERGSRIVLAKARN